MSTGQIKSLRYSAVEDRGRIYLAVFRELQKRYGRDEAISVMRGASRAHGIEVGQAIAHLAPNNLHGLIDEYFKGPDGGETFNPKINALSETSLDIQMQTCPLKDGWLDYGCSEEEVCTLLKCVTAFDEAVYETAGFEYELEAWKPGRAGCCRTIIRVKDLE